MQRADHRLQPQDALSSIKTCPPSCDNFINNSNNVFETKLDLLLLELFQCLRRVVEMMSVIILIDGNDDDDDDDDVEKNQ